MVPEGSPGKLLPTPSDQESGLTSAEVNELRLKFGPNELPERRPNPLVRVLAYFWGPIPWMIEIAVVLAALVRRWEDFSLIVALLAVNGLVGFWEERQAGNAVAALRARLAVQARVLRDGAWISVPARELVPGDHLRLRAGDVVPADVLLSGGAGLESDQSVLTGESLPVEKTPGETVYSGSTVTRGEADGRVSATGPKTYFGRTAELVETAHTVSHFQRAVLRIGNYLIVTAIALAILIELVSLFRGVELVTGLQFVLVLTIAAIPVALPTVLSVTMAVGARKMAHAEAVVTRLSSLEELAGMDVLCADKTGTLTQNRMTLGDAYAVAGTTAEGVVLAAALASRVENRDPIDVAVLARSPPRMRSGYEVIDYVPFDPTTKRTEASVRDAAGAEFSVSKGACQVIFELTHLAGEERDKADQVVAEFASRGYRTLGVARADPPGRGWRFLGILPLFDPLREDAREVVERVQELGVGVKVLTGDQLAIGRQAAHQLGLGSNFVTPDAVRPREGPLAHGPDPTLESADGFAQIFPADKFAIVEGLQRGGHIVGMTGDGVNDAPALRKADVGVAVSGATDVARGAASVVLLASGLKVIIDAIAESRRIFARMISYAIYRVGETVRILLFLSLAILAFDLFPVTAVMIVLIAVLNDGAILSIAYDRASVATSPTRWEMGLVLSVATVLGVVGVSFSFLLLVLALRVWILPFAVVQTVMYLKLSVAGHLGIFATRTRGAFWSSRPAPILLAAVLGTQTVATILAVGGFLLTPIPLAWAGVVWAFGLLDLFAFDLAKRATYRWFEGRHGRTGKPAPDARTRPSTPRTLFYHKRFGAQGHPVPARAERRP